MWNYLLPHSNSLLYTILVVPSGGNLQAIEKSDFWKKSDFFALNKWSGNFRLPAVVCF